MISGKIINLLTADENLNNLSFVISDIKEICIFCDQHVLYLNIIQFNITLKSKIFPWQNKIIIQKCNLLPDYLCKERPVTIVWD